MLRPSLTSLFFALPAAALADAPRVVTDIAPVHSLVSQVMGDLGQPDLLVSGNASPHNFALRPSQAGALEAADIVFYIGEDLTPWLETILERLAADAEQVELLHLAQTKTLPFRKSADFGEHNHDHGEEEDGHDDHADEHGHDDHADEDGHDDHAEADGHEGHNHGDTDPHAWLSPANAAVWLDVIAAELSEHDAENAATYAANAKAAKETLTQTVAEVEQILAPAKDTSFVVFHDAYHYFEAHFGVEARGSISLGDAAAPSPSRIESIQDVVREHKVTCVFSEPQFSEGLVNTVLDGTNAGVAVIDPLGATLDAGPELYPNLLRAMAKSIANC